MGGPNAIHLSLIFKTNLFVAVRVEPTSRRSADKLLFRSNHRGVNVKSSLVFIEKAAALPCFQIQNQSRR